MFLETTSFMVALGTLSPIVNVDPDNDDAKPDAALISNAW